MTDLTEQWKKGELPEGVYYCNTGNTVETLFTWGKNYHQLTNNKDEVYIPEMDDCEVLAPVPAYEEWKSAYECQIMESEEVTTLKYLLKECREFFYENLIDTEFHFSCGLGSNIKKQSCIRSLSNLKTKINKALGEE